MFMDYTPWRIWGLLQALGYGLLHHVKNCVLQLSLKPIYSHIDQILYFRKNSNFTAVKIYSGKIKKPGKNVNKSSYF